ncbi:hypothetical protein [Calothrix sp. NIES-3974]|nr:hypothetical protein [Calothrix sp. NIES-3974]
MPKPNLLIDMAVSITSYPQNQGGWETINNASAPVIIAFSFDY